MVSMRYIGIVSAPGSPPFCLAALDEEKRIVALSSGPQAEMVAFAAGQTGAILALNTPPRPKQVPTEPEIPIEGAGEKAPAERRPPIGRPAERELIERGYFLPRTPSDPIHCQGWMRRGFALFNQLTALGYTPFPDSTARAWLETHAGACYQSILGVPPFREGTLEGRIQRQLVLRDLHLPVANAMDFFEEITRYKLLHGILPVQNLHSAAELNALMAAQVAWQAAHQPERLQTFGDAEGGLLYLTAPATATAA